MTTYRENFRGSCWPYGRLRVFYRTGEKRAPKKGEWYLSGAIVEAYQAPNDLSTIHLIAKELGS